MPADIDMEDGRDRKLVAAAVAKGWGIKPQQLARYVSALDRALDISEADGDPRGIVSCVRTMATIVGQVQADEHLESRLAAGQMTDQAVTIRIVRDDQ